MANSNGYVASQNPFQSIATPVSQASAVPGTGFMPGSDTYNAAQATNNSYFNTNQNPTTSTVNLLSEPTGNASNQTGGSSGVQRNVNLGNGQATGYDNPAVPRDTQPGTLMGGSGNLKRITNPTPYTTDPSQPVSTATPGTPATISPVRDTNIGIPSRSPFGDPVNGGRLISTGPGTNGSPVNQNPVPNTTATPTTASMFSGTNIPTTANFGTSPYMANPTGTDGYGGTVNYNPNYFASNDTASQVAKMFGGTVLQQNVLGSGNTGPMSGAMSNMVQLPNGTIINPGKVAELYGAYSGPALQYQLQDLLGGSTGAAINGPQSFSGGQYPAGFQAGSPTQTTGITNPNTGVTTPYTQNALSTTPTTAASTASNATGSSTMDPAQLINALQFLSAYSGLGSGAGNPTSVNTSGQLGTGSSSGSNLDMTGLMQVLASMFGDNSLYSRQRQYPVTP